MRQARQGLAQTNNVSGALTHGCCFRREEDLHSSTTEAFFGSWRYFRCRSRASCVSKHWLLTGDLNFPPTLTPQRFPSSTPRAWFTTTALKDGPNEIAAMRKL